MYLLLQPRAGLLRSISCMLVFFVLFEAVTLHAIVCFESCSSSFYDCAALSGTCAGRCGDPVPDLTNEFVPSYVAVNCTEPDDRCVSVEGLASYNSSSPFWVSFPRGCLFDYQNTFEPTFDLDFSAGSQVFTCNSTDGCNNPTKNACTIAQALLYTETFSKSNTCYNRFNDNIINNVLLRNVIRGGSVQTPDMRNRCIRAQYSQQLDQNSSCLQTATCSAISSPTELDFVSCPECIADPNCDPEQDTPEPTNFPTKSPTLSPTKNPSLSPSFSPSKEPTNNPSSSPIESPSSSPTESPSLRPTESPTLRPSLSPTFELTNAPSESPTKNPTKGPNETTLSPTLSPIKEATSKPTSFGSNIISLPFFVKVSVSVVAFLVLILFIVVIYWNFTTKKHFGKLFKKNKRARSYVDTENIPLAAVVSKNPSFRNDEIVEKLF